MNLERHVYGADEGNIVIIKGDGGLFWFGGERIEELIAAEDTKVILDLGPGVVIGSGPMGCIFRASRRVSNSGGQMVIADPNDKLKAMNAIDQREGALSMFRSVEDAIRRFMGEDVSEIEIEVQPRNCTWPILFRPTGSEDADAVPNQVGRIVAFYRDGLLFHIESAKVGDADPVAPFLEAGLRMSVKFRPTFDTEGHYFEIDAKTSMVEIASAEDGKTIQVIRAEYGEIADEDRKRLIQCARDWEVYNDEHCSD